MVILQHTHYWITEWDDTRNRVLVRSVGARVLQRRANGEPHLCAGGDVVMQYDDGLTHRVSAKYFEGLKPEVAGEMFFN